MSKNLIAIAAALVTSGALVACLAGKPAAPATSAPSSAPAAPQAVNIDITGFAFQPATLTIPRGSTVTWTNKDATTHNAKGTFLTEDLTTGQVSKPIQFDTAGSLDYFCGFHPTMKANLVVQ